MEEAQITVVCNTELKKKGYHPQEKKTQEHTLLRLEPKWYVMQLRKVLQKLPVIYARKWGREVNKNTIRSIKMLFHSSTSIKIS